MSTTNINLDLELSIENVVSNLVENEYHEKKRGEEVLNVEDAKNGRSSHVVHESIAIMDCSRHRFVKKDEYRKRLRIECAGRGRILAPTIQFILALDIIFN